MGIKKINILYYINIIMNTFTINLNKNINIQINDFFSSSNINIHETEFFYNNLKNEIKDNNLIKDIDLKYNKYFFLIKFIFSIKNNNCILLYSDNNYIKDLENIILPKNIIDKIFIPLDINNDNIIEDINSYDINYLIILDPLLCYKLKDICNLPNFDVLFFNDIVIKYINMNIIQINNTNLKLKLKNYDSENESINKQNNEQNNEQENDKLIKLTIEPCNQKNDDSIIKINIDSINKQDNEQNDEQINEKNDEQNNEQNNEQNDEQINEQNNDETDEELYRRLINDTDNDENSYETEYEEDSYEVDIEIDNKVSTDNDIETDIELEYDDDIELKYEVDIDYKYNKYMTKDTDTYNFNIKPYEDVEIKAYNYDTFKDNNIEIKPYDYTEIKPYEDIEIRPGCNTEIKIYDIDIKPYDDILIKYKDNVYNNIYIMNDQFKEKWDTLNKKHGFHNDDFFINLNNKYNRLKENRDNEDKKIDKKVNKELDNDNFNRIFEANYENKVNKPYPFSSNIEKINYSNIDDIDNIYSEKITKGYYEEFKPININKEDFNVKWEDLNKKQGLYESSINIPGQVNNLENQKIKYNNFVNKIKKLEENRNKDDSNIDVSNMIIDETDKIKPYLNNKISYSKLEKIIEESPKNKKFFIEPMIELTDDIEIISDSNNSKSESSDINESSESSDINESGDEDNYLNNLYNKIDDKQEILKEYRDFCCKFYNKEEKNIFLNFIDTYNRQIIFILFSSLTGLLLYNNN